jgi:hypothetical protein
MGIRIRKTNSVTTLKKTGRDFVGSKWTIGSLSCFRKVMMYDIPGYLVVGNVG